MDTPMKNCWPSSCTPANTPTSFHDIQSEHLALHLTKSHLDFFDPRQAVPAGDDIVDAIKKMEALELAKQTESTTEVTPKEENSDYLLAAILQRQFDKEHNQLLENEEKLYNKQSKVKLSYEKYKSHCSVLVSSDDEDEDDESDYSDTNNSDHRIQFNKHGISGKGINMITKHDIKLCGRINSNRVLDNFSTTVDTGDSTNISMSNRVYNQIKCHNISEVKRSKRLHEKKEHSTAESAVDENTRLIIFKMINNAVLESVGGVISTGKEAAVLSAVGGSGFIKSKKGKDLGPIPRNCVVKVFKTTLIDFKNRGEYIKGDQRFFKNEFKKQNPRKILKIWAEKEAANLNRHSLKSNTTTKSKSMRRHEVPCPTVVYCRKHVLVMSMITHVNASGADESDVEPLISPAKQIKECCLTLEQFNNAYEQCIKIMCTMYKQCQLVHADLSEYNLLWDGQSSLYVIDVGQAVDTCHPRAMRFLLRDCKNVVKFFGDVGVEVASSYNLFNDITGKDLSGEGEEFLAQIEHYEKNEINLREQADDDYAFNYFYDKANKDRNTTDSDSSECIVQRNINIDNI